MTVRVRRLALPLALASLLALAPAGAASAAPSGVLWAGKTEDGGRVFMRTAWSDGVRRVLYFQAELTVRCEGTGELLDFTFASQPDAPVSEGAFSFDQVIFNTATHLDGVLVGAESSGTVSTAIAAFTPDEELQRCDSGPVSWKVHRRARGSSSAMEGLRVDVGRGTVTISNAGAAYGVAAGEPVRPWWGETRQGFPLFFETIGRPGSRRIGTYEIVADAPCPASDLGVVLQILGYADLPLDHGTWRIDEVSLFAATHWAGALADSEGHGTLEMSLPAFAPDEQLVVCTSGEVPWRALPGDVIGRGSGPAGARLVIEAA